MHLIGHADNSACKIKLTVQHAYRLLLLRPQNRGGGRGGGRGEGWGGSELSPLPQPKHFQFASDATVLDKTSLVTSISIQRLDICMASWEKKCNVFKSAFGE